MTTAKMRAIIAENTDGYFVAFLDNGGVRIGLRGCECFDFPETHEEFKRITKLTIDEIESAYDEFFSKYFYAFM